MCSSCLLYTSTEDEAERYLLFHEKVKDTQITREIDYCLKRRTVTARDFESGVRILVIGLGSKVIIADRVGICLLYTSRCV